MLSLHTHLEAIESEQRGKEKSPPPPFLPTCVAPAPAEGCCPGNVMVVLAPAYFPSGNMAEGCSYAFVLGAWPQTRLGIVFPELLTLPRIPASPIVAKPLLSPRGPGPKPGDFLGGSCLSILPPA